MTNHLRTVFESNLWRLVEGIVVAFTICISFALTTSNFLYLLVAGLYLIIRRQEVLLETREKQVVVILSALFSLFMVVGNIENILAVDFLFFWPITLLVCLYGFYLCFFCLIGNLLSYIRVLNVQEKTIEHSSKQIVGAFLISFIALLMVWGVALIASYPANTTADSNGIIREALKQTKMNPAVPIVYVLAVRFFLNLGITLFGTLNAGLGLCMAAHVFGLALIVAYFVSRLYKYKVKRWICVVVWAFYAFIPYNYQMSHTLWKDVPFAAFVTLFMIVLWELYMDSSKMSRVKEGASLFLAIIAGSGMCLLRNNGFFAFLFFLPFGLYLFYKTNKKVMVALIAALVLVRIIQGPVYDRIMTEQLAYVNEQQEKETVAEKEDTEAKEKTTTAVTEVNNATDSYNASGIIIVTSQQFARIAVERRDLSTEDYLRLNKVIDIMEIQETYNPHISDSAMKALQGMPTKEYLKEWLYFGLKYPIDYILAYKDQTYGYWYPDVQYWVYTDHIRDNELGLYRDTFLSHDTKYEQLKLEEMYKEIPIYGFLWSIGFVVWIMLLSIGVTYVKKGVSAMLLYFPVLGVWLTLLVATPVYAEFRYIYSMFFSLPLIILLPFIKRQQEADV